MIDPTGQQPDEQVQQIIHDVKSCLHAIGMGMELLKSVRGDDVRFAEICDLIGREKNKTMKLLADFSLLRATEAAVRAPGTPPRSPIPSA